MADDNKNPLDVLEELLRDKGGGASGAGSANGGAKVAADDSKEKAEAKAAAELEEKRKEFKQQQEEQQVVDKQKLAAHKEAILKIRDTGEYKARVEQDTEKKQELEKRASASDGFEINQLDHTKV